MDQTNTIVWRWDNTHAFGANLPNEGPDSNGQLFEYHPRFPGQYFDKETGLHYNYFRYYEPETGRYISPDPIGLAGGINVFEYANSNSTVFVDPDGLCPWCVGAVVAGIFDFAVQYWRNDGDLDCIDWTGVGASTALGAAGGGILNKLRMPYWRYVGPKSNQNSPWMTRGYKPPYGHDMAKAKDKLQLPNMPTHVQKIDVPWWQPVRGPGPARNHPEWGSGGGPEYSRGWTWLE